MFRFLPQASFNLQCALFLNFFQAIWAGAGPLSSVCTWTLFIHIFTHDVVGGGTGDGRDGSWGGGLRRIKYFIQDYLTVVVIYLPYLLLLLLV